MAAQLPAHRIAALSFKLVQAELLECPLTLRRRANTAQSGKGSIGSNKFAPYLIYSNRIICSVDQCSSYCHHSDCIRATFKFDTLNDDINARRVKSTEFVARIHI